MLNAKAIHSSILLVSKEKTIFYNAFWDCRIILSIFLFLDIAIQWMLSLETFTQEASKNDISIALAHPLSYLQIFYIFCFLAIITFEQSVLKWI